MNLHQNAKNQAILSNSSGDMADIKMVHSDWLRVISTNMGFAEKTQQIV